VEDYSDLLADNDSVFNGTNSRLSLAIKEAPQLFHPSDLTSLPRSMQNPVAGSQRRQSQSRPSVLPDRHMRRTRSTVEITKFAESEGDEDFSDIFGAGDALTEKAESDQNSEDGNLMLLSKLSNNSWLGDDEDEDDPFAMMDPGWDDMDLQANIARDRHARLAEKVEELVRSLKTTEGEDKLSELAEDLVSLLIPIDDAAHTNRFKLALLWENTEVKDLIISAHGLLPILEILEPCTVKSRQHMILQLLKIVNAVSYLGEPRITNSNVIQIILDDVELQENLCFVGGIPIITKFAARQYSNEIRLEAAAFVRQMYQTSTLTLQMFVSAGGLNVLVEFLDEDYDTSQSLVLIGVNGIWCVFELQGPTPKNDFCRIFSRSKILDPLAAVLHKVLEEEDKNELSELIEGRIVNIFYLFSQAENYVKEVVADRQVLKTVLKDLRRMTPGHQITMLKFIKNLSMLSTTIESLHSADAIDFLIDVLSHSMKRGAEHFREISNQVLNTMFNLCRLSKERQEYAAGNGIIPLLLKILKTDRPPKEFVLPILCDMAHSGKKGRRYLWQNNGLDFYVSLLSDQYWQVTALDAIFVWLQEETAKVESHLLDGNFTAAITACFASTKVNAFDLNLLEPLLKVLRLSPAVAASLAKADMYAGIAQKFSHKKAVVRLNLLRLVRSIMDGCESDSTSAVSTSSTGRQLRVLFDAIKTLADKDPAVLVRNLASELVRGHIDMDLRHDAVALPSLGQHPSMSAAASGPRARSGPRRSSSYTPPGLHASVSMPPTPTHAHAHPYHRQSHQVAAFIEVAATPKRTAVTATHEREAGLYRPRSRDGSGLVTHIPRRVSGEGAMVNNNPSSSSSSGTTPAKSRLPRTSMAHGGHGQFGGRPSLTSAVSAPSVSRSESSSSNKENVGRAGSGSISGGQQSGSAAAARLLGSGAREQRETGVSGGKRRARAPSSDVRWS
jgi:hypothetical protein